MSISVFAQTILKRNERQTKKHLFDFCINSKHIKNIEIGFL